MQASISSPTHYRFDPGAYHQSMTTYAPGGPTGPARERALLKLSSHHRSSYADIPIDYGHKVPGKMPPTVEQGPEGAQQFNSQTPKPAKNPSTSVHSTVTASLAVKASAGMMKTSLDTHKSQDVTDP